MFSLLITIVVVVLVCLVNDRYLDNKIPQGFICLCSFILGFVVSKI